MRLLIAAVGRQKAGPEAAIVEEYLGRIRAAGRPLGVFDVEVREIEAPKGADASKRKRLESELLLAAIPDRARTIVLDGRGDQMSSESFARLLADWRDQGTPVIAFLIGGAEGLDRPALAAADRTIGFGAATWPHLLVRAMLVEQIYRAMTILSGHPYHRA